MDSKSFSTGVILKELALTVKINTPNRSAERRQAHPKRKIRSSPLARMPYQLQDHQSCRVKNTLKVHVRVDDCCKEECKGLCH